MPRYTKLSNDTQNALSSLPSPTICGERRAILGAAGPPLSRRYGEGRISPTWAQGRGNTYGMIGDGSGLFRASRGVLNIGPLTGPANIRALRIAIGIGPALVADINPNHRI